MKYVLPLMLVTSAALAAARETPWDLLRLWPAAAEPQAAPLHMDPPWLTGDWDVPGESAAALNEAHAGDDPRAGLYGSDDPHAGLHLGEASATGMCPREQGDEPETEALPDAVHAHANLRDHALASSVQAVPRSTAANGRSVAEVFSERAALSERRVRVRGTVVKLTDGILGKTYLHLRDGSGSREREDDDLTIATTGEFQVGETVEIEGQLRVDQDLGVGYRYAALLEDATRITPN